MTQQEIAGNTFIHPSSNRWCSEYYVGQRDVELEKVNVYQSAFEIAAMTES